MTTVPELRALCRAAGLPTYQRHGRRLRKADLVRLLASQDAQGIQHDVLAGSDDQNHSASRSVHSVAVSGACADLAAATVAELRSMCRERNLPAWQQNGRRLRKADLLRLLTDERAEILWERVDTTDPDRHGIAPEVREQMIHAATAALTWYDDEYRIAMHRYMSGRATDAHEAVLRGVRARAIQRLRDRSEPGSIEYSEWAGMMQAN